MKQLLITFTIILFCGCTTYYKVQKDSLDYSGVINNLIDYNIHLSSSYSSNSTDKKSALLEQHPFYLSISFKTKNQEIESLLVKKIVLKNAQNTKLLDNESLEIKKFKYDLKFDGTRSANKKVFYHFNVGTIDYNNLKLDIETEVTYKNGNKENNLIICDIIVESKIFKTTAEFQSLMGI